MEEEEGGGGEGGRRKEGEEGREEGEGGGEGGREAYKGCRTSRAGVRCRIASPHRGRPAGVVLPTYKRTKLFVGNGRLNFLRMASFPSFYSQCCMHSKNNSTV